jgi:hypothetical protein
VDVGSWDFGTRNFTPLPGSTDPDLVRAVRARTRRDDSVNGPVQTILGKAVGVDSIPVNTEAVAHWGFAGGGGPGVVDLPITIDCCAISGDTPGSACTQNYCDTVSSQIPNPCPLSGGGTATCLEFYATPEQNACWTVFEPDNPAVSTSDLRDVIGAGNPHDIGGEPIYLDNGTKIPPEPTLTATARSTRGWWSCRWSSARTPETTARVAPPRTSWASSASTSTRSSRLRTD